MRTYEVEDYSGNVINLFADGKIIEANTGSEAMKTYLKKVGAKIKVKCSGDREVQFKVTPIFIDEHGKKYIDRRGGKKATWYKIISEA